MNLQLEILKTLRDACGHPLLRSVLRSQVDSRVRPRPMTAVFNDALQNLADKGYILETVNELDDADPFFILDERGEAYATKMRL